MIKISFVGEKEVIINDDSKILNDIEIFIVHRMNKLYDALLYGKDDELSARYEECDIIFSEIVRLKMEGEAHET